MYIGARDQANKIELTARGENVPLGKEEEAYIKREAEKRANQIAERAKTGPQTYVSSEYKRENEPVKNIITPEGKERAIGKQAAQYREYQKYQEREQQERYKDVPKNVVRAGKTEEYLQERQNRVEQTIGRQNVGGYTATTLEKAGYKIKGVTKEGNVIAEKKGREIYINPLTRNVVAEVPAGKATVHSSFIDSIEKKKELNKQRDTSRVYDTNKVGRANSLDNNRDVGSNISNSGTTKEDKVKKSGKVKEFFKGAANLILSPVRGAGKLLYGPNVGGKKPLVDIGQGKYFTSEGTLASDPDVQATIFVGATAGLMNVAPLVAKAGITGIAIYSVIKTTKNPTPYAVGETSAMLVLAGSPFLFKAGRTINKAVNPKYVTYENTNVAIVESVTIPTERANLLGFEGKTVPTVHTTLSSQLKPGSVIKPAPDSALSPWRKNIGQRSFYSSSPVEAKVQKLVGSRYSDTSVWTDTTFKQTPLTPQYQPVAYGGYIGIGEGTSESQVSFSVFPKSAKAFVFRETEIKPTPKSVAKKNVRDVVKFQSENAGTYVAAENIKGMSKEGQFTTSPGTELEPLMQITKAKGPLAGKFTYYKETKPVPGIFGGEKSPKPVKAVWDFLTSKETKVKFNEVAFEEVQSKVGKPKSKEKPLDLAEYNAKSQVSSKNVNLMELPKPIRPSRPKKSSSRQIIVRSVPIISSSKPVSSSPSKPVFSRSSAPSSSDSVSVVSEFSSPKSSQRSSSTSRSEPMSSPSKGSLSKSLSKSSKKSSSKSSFKSRTSSIRSSTKIPPTTPPPSSPFSDVPTSQEKRKKSVFVAKVKKKGMFRIIAKETTAKRALRKAKLEAFNTASASFTVEGNKQEVERAAREILPRQSYRRSKLDRNVFVERRGYRIKSSGEKRDITQKGIFANMAKSKKRKFSLF